MQILVDLQVGASPIETARVRKINLIQKIYK